GGGGGGGGARREAARAVAGERGRGSAEERLCTRRRAEVGAPRRGAPPSRARGIDDDRAVHRRPGGAAAYVPRPAHAAGRLAGGGAGVARRAAGGVPGARARDERGAGRGAAAA